MDDEPALRDTGSPFRNAHETAPEEPLCAKSSQSVAVGNHHNALQLRDDGTYRQDDDAGLLAELSGSDWAVLSAEHQSFEPAAGSASALADYHYEEGSPSSKTRAPAAHLTGGPNTSAADDAHPAAKQALVSSGGGDPATKQAMMYSSGGADSAQAMANRAKRLAAQERDSKRGEKPPRLPVEPKLIQHDKSCSSDEELMKAGNSFSRSSSASQSPLARGRSLRRQDSLSSEGRGRLDRIVANLQAERARRSRERSSDSGDALAPGQQESVEYPVDLLLCPGSDSMHVDDDTQHHHLAEEGGCEDISHMMPFSGSLERLHDDNGEVPFLHGLVGDASRMAEIEDRLLRDHVDSELSSDTPLLLQRLYFDDNLAGDPEGSYDRAEACSPRNREGQPFYDDALEQGVHAVLPENAADGSPRPSILLPVSPAHDVDGSSPRHSTPLAGGNSGRSSERGYSVEEAAPVEQRMPSAGPASGIQPPIQPLRRPNVSHRKLKRAADFSTGSTSSGAASSGARSTVDDDCRGPAAGGMPINSPPSTPPDHAHRSGNHSVSNTRREGIAGSSSGIDRETEVLGAGQHVLRGKEVFLTHRRKRNLPPLADAAT